MSLAMYILNIFFITVIFLFLQSSIRSRFYTNHKSERNQRCYGFSRFLFLLGISYAWFSL